MRIGIEVKPFNAAMRMRRQELKLTQKGLAVLANVPIDFVSRVELLKMPTTAKSRNGKRISIINIRDKLNRIAQALELEFDYLFPQDYLDAIQQEFLPRRKTPMIWIREVNIFTLPLQTPDLILPNPESDLIDDTKDGLFDTMSDLLNQLPYVQRKVIELRFGFGLDRELTLEEVANQLSVTKERVRQLEAKALRNLRHPMKTIKFRHYFHR